MNGAQVVSNDGLHGAETRCGSLHLHKGWHLIKAVGFQAGGGAFFDATYGGPDTDSKQKAMRSIRFRRYTFRRSPGFSMKVYNGPSGMSSIPKSTHGMTLAGQAIVNKIAFGNQDSFKQAVPATPNENFVWVFGGTLYIER